MSGSSQDEESAQLLSGEVKGGVQPDSYIDGRARRWSWGCSKCGEWEDCYPGREFARIDYKKHKDECKGRPEAEAT